VAQYKRVPEYLSRYGTPIARQDLVLEYPFCIARARVAIPVRSAGCATTTGELHRGAGAGARAGTRPPLPPPLPELDGADVLGDARCGDGTCVNEMFYHVD
jgi:hypothetical protein